MNSDNIGKKEIMVTHMHRRKHIQNNCRLSSLACFPLKWPLWLSWFVGYHPHCGRPGLVKKGLTQNTNRNRVSDSCEPNVPLKKTNYWNYYWQEWLKRFLSRLTKYNILHVLCLCLLKCLFQFQAFQGHRKPINQIEQLVKVGKCFWLTCLTNDNI